jgi:hypothetical protein
MKIFLIALVLSGCASYKGVQMDDDERKACALEGCNVYTAKEIRELARKMFTDGVKLGRKSI